MKSRIFAAVCLLLALALPVRAVELTVYTDIEPEQLKKYESAFKARHSDISVKWVRDSAGPITARLLAEKDAPKADIIFGLSLASVLFLDEKGLLEPYTPQGADQLLPAMRDARENPTWVSVYGWSAAIIANKPELERLGLPVPQSFSDLADPKYKGCVVMPNPVSSGTGYMILGGLLQSRGGEKGWAYIAELHKNIRMYVHSGSKPAQMAAQGEAPIGLSSPSYAAPFLARKAPIEIVSPKDGAPWDQAAVALVKQPSPNAATVEAAKKLMDFACSPETAEIAVNSTYLPNRPSKDGHDAPLLHIDFSRNAAARDAFLAAWKARFEAAAK